MLKNVLSLQFNCFRVYSFARASCHDLHWFTPVNLRCVGSKALQYLSIPLFTVFKNLTIVIIAYGELLFFGGSKVSGLMLISFILMVTSSLIAGYSDFSQGNLLKKDENQVSALVSYLWMVANCLSTAFYALIMRSKIKQVNFKDYDTVYYNNLLSIPVLLIASFVCEIDEGRRVYAKYTGEGSDEATGLVVAILVSSVSSFAISYGSSWCVRVTSSTVCLAHAHL